MIEPTKSETLELRKEIRSAIERLVKVIDAGGRAEALLAIGLVAADDLLAIGASLLFEGDLPAGAEPYQRLSPVEWRHSEEKSFDELNHHLAATIDASAESNTEYERRVRGMFRACADVLVDLDLRRKYGASLFLTFAGVDPNDLLEAEERAFVRRLNSSETFQQWCDEFG